MIKCGTIQLHSEMIKQLKTTWTQKAQANLILYNTYTHVHMYTCTHAHTHTLTSTSASSCYSVQSCCGRLWSTRDTAGPRPAPACTGWCRSAEIRQWWWLMNQVTHLDCHSTATNTTLHSILLNTLHTPCKTDISILINSQIAHYEIP